MAGYVLLWLSLQRHHHFHYLSFVLGILFAMVASQYLPLLYYHPRPFADGLGVMLVHHQADSSFPSNHTTFLMAVLFAVYWNSRPHYWSKVALIIALLGAWGRIYVGVHYPFDIVGSTMLAALITGMVTGPSHLLMRSKNMSNKKNNSTG